jgi:hypothetical protein
MDLMISKMLEAGLTVDDLAHLERLSDPMILSRIPIEKRDQMSKNCKEDVILYMETWANMLREKWVLESELNLDFVTEKKLKLPLLV